MLEHGLFSKNDFKKKLTHWMLNHVGASEAELIDFCRAEIPEQALKRYHWLVDEAVQWFRWVHDPSRLEQHRADAFQDT